MTATLRDLLNIIFRSKRALVIFWVVATLAVFVFYSQTERKYDSKARILVSIGTENQGRADYLVNKNMQLLQREQQIHDEQQILLSDHVLLTTAKWILGEPTPGEPMPQMGPELAEARRSLTGELPEPTLMMKAIKVVIKGGVAITKPFSGSHKDARIPESTSLATRLSKDIDAKTVFNSDVLDVSFRYRDPRVAQTVLKLVLAAYMQHHIAVFQSTGESDLLKGELDRSVGDYQKKLDQLAAFMTTNRVFAEDSQIDSLIQQRRDISQALTDAAADNQASSARIATFSSLNDSIKRYETYSTTESRNKIHEELVSRLNEAQVQEQQILNAHPVGSRAYQDQSEVLDKIRGLLTTQPTQVTDQKEERRSGASELVEQQLISSNAAQKSAQARMEQLRRELTGVNESIDSYARNLPGYNMIKLSLNLSKEQSQQMGQAYLNSRLRTLTAQNEITDISIVDAPSWQPDPASPKKALVMLLYVALLALGSVSIVLIQVGLDQTVTGGRSAQAALNLPVAAVLPKIFGEFGTASLLEADIDNELARMYMAFRDAPTPGAVVLVAGSNSGEGLSLIGYDLARFLERRSHVKTAVLDFTANPFKPAKGETGPTVLTVPAVGAGAASASTAELLTQWRKEYSYIVVACNVARDLHRMVDVLPAISATFVVMEAGKTRRGTAARTVELLRSYGTRSIELIVNKREFFIPEWLVRRV